MCMSHPGFRASSDFINFKTYLYEVLETVDAHVVSEHRFGLVVGYGGEGRRGGGLRGARRGGRARAQGWETLQARSHSLQPLDQCLKLSCWTVRRGCRLTFTTCEKMLYLL